MDWVKDLQQPKYWLLAIITAIVTLHLTFLWRSEDADLQSMSVLLWLGVASLLWEKKNSLNFESGLISSLVGLFIIAIVLIRATSPAGYHLYLSPFLSFLGVCLLASGSHGIRQYWKELIILGLLVLTPVLSFLLRAIDLPTLSAMFGNFMLAIAGFSPVREGVLITLANGGVEVYGACSGLESIIQMFNIAVIFLLIVPTTKIQKIISIVVAVLLGFVVNGIRVTLLALLVNFEQMEAFKYWHGGDGTIVFSVMGVILFGIFCWLAFLRNPEINSNSGEY